MKRFITLLIYLVAALHFGLLVVDRMPFLKISFSLACLASSFLILPEFPAVEYTSPVFIGSVLMSLVNHFSWFFYFVSSDYDRYSNNYNWGNGSVMQVTAFFTLVVWSVPLAILVSLVSPSSYLPTTDPNAPKRQSAIKALLSQFDLLRNFTERASTRLRHHHNY